MILSIGFKVIVVCVNKIVAFVYRCTDQMHSITQTLNFHEHISGSSQKSNSTREL